MSRDPSQATPGTVLAAVLAETLGVPVDRVWIASDLSRRETHRVLRTHPF
jgi:hypothetical protein